MRLFAFCCSAGLLQSFVRCESETDLKLMPRAVSSGFCTNVSLGAPGWEISSFVLRNNRIDFQLSNNANPDTSIICSGEASASASHNQCNERQTQFTYDRTLGVLKLNQTWTCDESGLTFVGIGNVTLDCPSVAATSTCPLSKPKAVHASLLSPVEITPEPVTPPLGADKEGCTRNSRTPTWEIGGLYYQRLDFGPPCIGPSGQCPPGRLYYGGVEFNLANLATGDRRHCEAKSLGLSDLSTGYKGSVRCDAGVVFIDMPPTPSRAYETMTTFWFDHRSNTLELNQTWYCEDAETGEEYKFTASGAVSPALDPGIPYINNMTIPQVRVPASASVLTARATAVSEQKLPPNTLRRPQAFGGSCTSTSLLNPPRLFQISDFWFSTYWKDAKTRTSYVYMYVTNWVFNIDLNFNSEGEALTPGIVGVSDPDMWYGCNGGAFLAPAGGPLLNCSFSYDRMANRLSVREDWICADKDHGHPILFTVVAQGAVTMNDSLCQTSKSEGPSENRSCPGPKMFSIAVTNYSWRPCTAGDNCPRVGSGFNWEEQFS